MKNKAKAVLDGKTLRQLLIEACNNTDPKLELPGSPIKKGQDCLAHLSDPFAIGLLNLMLRLGEERARLGRIHSSICDKGTLCTETCTGYRRQVVKIDEISEMIQMLVGCVINEAYPRLASCGYYCIHAGGEIVHDIGKTFEVSFWEGDPSPFRYFAQKLKRSLVSKDAEISVLKELAPVGKGEKVCGTVPSHLRALFTYVSRLSQANRQFARENPPIDGLRPGEIMEKYSKVTMGELVTAATKVKMAESMARASSKLFWMLWREENPKVKDVALRKGWKVVRCKDGPDAGGSWSIVVFS